MSAIISPLNQIEIFNYEILRAPVRLEVIESAKKYFQELLCYSDDPACMKALNQAKVLLELKEEQAILASKIESVVSRFNELDQSIRAAGPANYEDLSQKIGNLKKDLEDLNEDAFPMKTPLLAKLGIYSKAIESQNPSAWKTQVLIHSLLATSIGLLFAANASGTSMTGALNDLDKMAHSFNSSICDPSLSCSDTISPGVLVGAGILIGFTGVAINTLRKISRKAVLLIAQGSIWAASKIWAPGKKEVVDRPKLSNGSIADSFDHISLKPLPLTKQFAYDKLTGGKAPADPLHLSLHRMTDMAVLDCKIFQNPKQPVVEKSGPFAFPPSTDKTLHWTADFTNQHLFEHVEEPLLGQEELMALEHPVLYHLHEALGRTPDLQPLADGRIALIANVGRYGALKGLFGSEFASSSPETIDAHLERFENPVFSHLFAISAPQNPDIGKEHLKELFVKACTAFTAIANQSESLGMKPIAHTSGAFSPSPLAAALCQILAARVARIELHYYTMGDFETLAKAERILANIERQAPSACIGEILVHLALHAKEYRLDFVHF